MQRIKLLLAAMLFFQIASQAQTIEGKLLDLVDNTPLAGASVKLTRIADTSYEKNTVTDRFGFFSFTGLPRDSFMLQVTSVGYDHFRQIIVLSDSFPSIELGVVFVPKKATEMGEVKVISRTPPTQQKGDTLQYNASQFKVNPDASAEDMIRKMPGVTVERGQVTAQGEQVQKVTIDGREFFGDDATAALRNIPAEVIDKIQVFDRLSDQAQFTGFDDGNAVKAINIVTKEDMRNGQFGRVYAGYGTDDRYQGGGNVTFFNDKRRISIVGQMNNINQQNFASQDLLGVSSNPNRGRGGRGGGPRGGGGGGGWGMNRNFLVGQQPGISKTNALGINFSNQWGPKLEVSGSYFFNNSNNLNKETTTGQYIFPGATQFVDENSLSENENFNHRINMRLEYRIDSNNQIFFTPRINFQNSKSLSSQYSLVTSDIGELINQFDSRDNSDNKGYSIDNEITYRRSFAKRGRSISLEVETEFDRNSGNYFSESVSRYQSFGGDVTDSINQYTDQLSRGYNVELSLSYTEPIGKKGQLQFNYRPSFSNNNAEQETFHFDNNVDKYTIFDDSLSNSLDNRYRTQNAGLSYRVGDRENQFAVGIDYQHSVLEGEQQYPYVADVNRTFTNFLPNLRWTKRFSPASSLRVFYRARTNAPSVRQLQGVINPTNLLFPSTGNPDLEQATTHFIAGRYNYTNSAKRTSFFANVFVQKTDNYISSAVLPLISDSVISSNLTLPAGARLSIPVNIDGYWNARSFFTFGMPLNFIKSNLNWNGGISYTRAPGLILEINESTNKVDTSTNISNTVNYNFGAVIASNISEYVDFTVSYSGNINQVSNSESTQLDGKYFTQSAGVQLNLLSKNGWVFRNDLTNQMYSGLSEGFNQNYWLWNMSIGKKFLKDQKGELQLSVFDLLKQNQAINREITSTSVLDVRNEVLQQYFMVTFFYKLRNFGGKK